MGLLVLARMRDQSIEIGSHDTTLLALTEAEVAAIEVAASLVAEFAPGAEPPHEATLVALVNRLKSVAMGPAEVIVVDIRGEKVRLGTLADKSIPVHRKEVAEQIRRESKAA